MTVMTQIQPQKSFILLHFPHRNKNIGLQRKTLALVMKTAWLKKVNLRIH